MKKPRKKKPKQKMCELCGQIHPPMEWKKGTSVKFWVKETSTMKISNKTKKLLTNIGMKGDTYEDLILLLLSFKDTHKKQFNDYVDSIRRGD